MLDEKVRFEDDEDDVYIPDIGEDSPQELNLEGRSLRSNAGIALSWSKLEQQIFDLLLVNRFSKDAYDTTEDQVDAIRYLLENFDINEIVRIGAVATLSKQLELAEGKGFLNEYEKYKEYIRRNPADAED